MRAEPRRGGFSYPYKSCSPLIGGAGDLSLPAPAAPVRAVNPIRLHFEVTSFAIVTFTLRAWLTCEFQM
jgi:hypothetical protein